MSFLDKLNYRVSQARDKVRDYQDKSDQKRISRIESATIRADSIALKRRKLADAKERLATAESAREREETRLRALKKKRTNSTGKAVRKAASGFSSFMAHIPTFDDFGPPKRKTAKRRSRK